ncbi:MAG: tRNA uridine-5-carboxymethylaminomethyl(34) synthesis GTPase MnmE [FCB group bacterium]|nr:tRNA uridine-5-carboxymethylaminomethyl(34) synthesis GTPase MnmE [FCB group bacterium]
MLKSKRHEQHKKKSKINLRHIENSDTIVAIITPPGEGGIAALRLVGKNCLTFLQKHFQSAASGKKSFVPFVMRYGYFVDAHNDIIDEIMAVFMPAGKSYTGQNQVEIFCHGGRKVVQLILDEFIADGARVAEPGEFTKMAFLSGRIDLTHAEAVAEIIAADTDTSYKAAREHLIGSYQQQIDRLQNDLINILAEVEASIDYPEEEINTADKERLLRTTDVIMLQLKELVDTYQSGRIIKEGFKIAIGGRPNAGKSSLFNLLLKQQRALVTPQAGTTRDYLSEWIELKGFKVNLIDTAGLRQGGGMIEKEGQKSARKIIDSSHLLLWMIDLTQKSWQKTLKTDLESLKKYHIVLLGNKIDAIDPSLLKHQYIKEKHILLVSCKTGKGINNLKSKISEIINESMPDLTSGLVVTSARHRQKLMIARSYLRKAKMKIKNNETPELTAFELRYALNALEEITGKIYNEDILDRIFSKFCIGK